jgi:hypothetical protein
MGSMPGPPLIPFRGSHGQGARVRSLKELNGGRYIAGVRVRSLKKLAEG